MIFPATFYPLRQILNGSQVGSYGRWQSSPKRSQRLFYSPFSSHWWNYLGHSHSSSSKVFFAPHNFGTPGCSCDPHQEHLVFWCCYFFFQARFFYIILSGANFHFIFVFTIMFNYSTVLGSILSFIYFALYLGATISSLNKQPINLR